MKANCGGRCRYIKAWLSHNMLSKFHYYGSGQYTGLVQGWLLGTPLKGLPFLLLNLLCISFLLFFSLVKIYNDLIGLSYKKFAAKFNIGSNSYPNVISETKNLTLTKIVQVSTHQNKFRIPLTQTSCFVVIYLVPT